MEQRPPTERMEAALAAEAPLPALLGLARELRDGGMPQADLHATFDAARARRAGEADGAGCDAILEAMDLIDGWCAPSRALYPGPDRPP